MSKIRKQYKDKYTVVLNAVIEDERLSYKAVGLFVDLWHSPDDWDYYLSEIANRHTDKKDSVKSGLEELEKYGYLRRSNKHRNSNGKFDSYDWTLSETPMVNQSGLSAAVNNRVGKSAAVNQPLQSTKRQSTENNKVIKEEVAAASTTPLGVQNVIVFYQDNIGMVPPIVTQSIQMWCKDLSPEMVQEAIKRAAESHRTWRYAEGILRSWVKRNINTMDKVKADDVSFARSHEQQSYQRKSSAKKKVESYGQGEYAIEKAKADRGEIPF